MQNPFKSIAPKEVKIEHVDDIEKVMVVTKFYDVKRLDCDLAVREVEDYPITHHVE